MVDAIGAINGFGGFGGLGSIPGIGEIGTNPSGGAAGVSSVGGGRGGAGADFGLNLNDALSKVQGQIDNADLLAQQLATGQLTDIHEYTVAASKASLSVQLTVALRNQALGAYQEIMRMQL